MGDREGTGASLAPLTPWLRRAPLGVPARQPCRGEHDGPAGTPPTKETLLRGDPLAPRWVGGRVRRRSTYDRETARSLITLGGVEPVCSWSRRARLSAPPARSNRTMTCRSACTTDAAWERQGLRCSARLLVGSSWPPAAPRTRPWPRRRARPGPRRSWRRRARPALVGWSLASSR